MNTFTVNKFAKRKRIYCLDRDGLWGYRLREAGTTALAPQLLAWSLWVSAPGASNRREGPGHRVNKRTTSVVVPRVSHNPTSKPKMTLIYFRLVEHGYNWLNERSSLAIDVFDMPAEMGVCMYFLPGILGLNPRHPGQFNPAQFQFNATRHDEE
ncbi:hypothetical protein BJ165DRAFT_1570684 [Panaeolus papilionaceus]|nr:hypothetical protein BJ165DRAFT_1570684 [Panaeolus papilionaceus]